MESDAGQRESYMQFQLDRQTDPESLQELEKRVRSTLEDVNLATSDWRSMRQSVLDIVAGLEQEPPPRDPEELAEFSEFCRWIEARTHAQAIYQNRTSAAFSL